MAKAKTEEEYRRPLPMRCSPGDIQDYTATDRPHGHDGQPPEHIEQRTLVWEDGKRIAGTSPFNVNHSRVCALFTRQRIGKRQLAAAEKLAKDWQTSLIQPMASSVLVGGGSSGGDNHPNDDKIKAMRRHGDAVEALGAGWPLVELVVQKNLSVEEATKQLGRHFKWGHGALWVALHTLADHYGLPKDE